LVAELEESDGGLFSVEDFWLMAGILGFRQMKERVEARVVNQGVVVQSWDEDEDF
jgi:hypothetical protein